MAIDSFKKGIRIGIGLLSKTAQEVEQHVHSFAKSRHLPAKKARALVRDVLKTVSLEKKRLRSSLRKETRTRLHHLRASSHKEADKFLAHMLEWQLEMQEKMHDGSSKALQKASRIKAHARSVLHASVSKAVEKVVDGVTQEPVRVVHLRATKKAVKKRKK